MPSSAAYLNFDLLITRAGERYRALVVDAPGGDADIFFDLPPSLPGFQELLALTSPRRGLHDAPAQTKPVASLDDVGRLLYEAIFQGEVRDVLVASQREAADKATGLRLRLRFHEDAADLATLPWEILYDAGQARFLALSESLPILRYLSLPRPRPALVTEPPLRILAVLASPDGLDELDLDGEWQVLAEALAGLVDDGKVVLERLASPTPSALQKRLMGDAIHVLHFVGHGVFDEESKQGMLVLADERSQPKLMGARELATLLANHTSLRLLYLNACEGALGDDANVFAGLAQRLVQGGAPAAIAMQAEISDRASIDLARTFYTALATGRPVDAALTQARVTLAMNSSVEWATPVLFSRAPDNRLFDIRDVLPTPECPYPGMKPFTEKQKEFFFGRDKEIDDAVNRLVKHPFLAVVGPSGSGKSSLVYAGILPALRASRRFGPGPWTAHTLRPSDARTADGKAAPMQALSQLGDLSPQSPITSHQSPTLLIIDQFEETFTLADAAEARAFLDAMHGLIGQPNLYILLTVRADFYPNMMAMGDLWANVQARRLELTPLGEDELWAAIVEPAARVGVEVEDALATALIADARGEAGVLPLVQETLVRLWDRVEGRQLKRSAYRQMADGGRSGIQVAINDHANDIYHTLPAADRSIARRIFLRLIQFGEGRADTRRQQTVSELRAGGDDPVRFDETLNTLVGGRLLTASGEEGDPNRRVDISHEALIGGWALLQGWIGEMRAAESTRRRLEDKVAEWERLDKTGGLLDEYELREAEQWLHSDYSRELGYSRALVDLVDASKDAQAHAEEEKAQAERTRQWSRLFAAGLALATVAIALVGWFWWQANEARAVAVTAQIAAEVSANEATVAKENAERQRRIALASQLAADSIISLEIENRADRALLLAVEAISATHEIDGIQVIAAEEALHRSLSALSADPIMFSQQNTKVSSLVFDRTGDMLGLVSHDAVNILDLRQLESARAVSLTSTITTPELFAPTAWRQPRGVSLRSPDNLWEATTVDASLISLRNLQSTAEPSILFGHEGEIAMMQFTPDSRHLISVAADGTVRVWDVNEPNVKSTVLRGHTAAMTALALDPARMRLATGSLDSMVRIWNLRLPTEAPIVLRDQRSPIQDLAYSPDGKWLAALGENGEVTIWRDDIDRLVQTACDVLTRNLTVQEWKLSLATSPYRKTCPQIPYPPITGQYTNLKIVDTFLVVGRELRQDGWQLLGKAGLFDLLFTPAQLYRGPSLEQLPNLSLEERESIGRNLIEFGPSTRLIGTTDFLWQRPELFSIPLPPPDAQLIAVDPLAGQTEQRVAELWNNNGSLIAAIASELGLDVDVVVGTLLIETSGSPSDRLSIRFENHIFYRFWGEFHREMFGQHFSFNPETPWLDHRWRLNVDQDWQPMHTNQQSEWEALEFARTLDEAAALSSISMGKPQIMGFNYASLGFSDVHAMFAVFLSPNSQDRINITSLFDFTRSRESLQALRHRDFLAFARAYNGVGQAEFYAGLISQSIDAFNAMRQDVSLPPSSFRLPVTPSPSSAETEIDQRRYHRLPHKHRCLKQGFT